MCSTCSHQTDSLSQTRANLLRTLFPTRPPRAHTGSSGQHHRNSSGHASQEATPGGAGPGTPQSGFNCGPTCARAPTLLPVSSLPRPPVWAWPAGSPVPSAQTSRVQPARDFPKDRSPSRPFPSVGSVPSDWDDRAGWPAGGSTAPGLPLGKMSCEASSSTSPARGSLPPAAIVAPTLPSPEVGARGLRPGHGRGGALRWAGPAG